MKNKKFMALGLVGVATVALVGCQEETEKETVVAEDKTVDTETATVTTTKAEEIDADVVEALQEAIYENADNMQNEDLESYLEDLVLPDEDKETVGEQIQQIFNAMDVVYEIKDIQVLDVTDTTASVQVTQVSKAVKSSVEFNNNEGVVVHKMQLEDGKWKFVSAEVKSVTYLDDETVTDVDVK